MSTEGAATKASICVVIPVYNEESALELFHKRLSTVLDALSIRSEILYVDDGSSDSTALIIDRMMDGDTRIGLLRLSRNFGKDTALSAGLDYVDADAVVCIDADLQHPPEVISSLVDGWLDGFDIVYGVRDNRRDQNLIRRMLSGFFYRVLGISGEVRIPPDVGDFRLMSRRVFEALRQFRESHRFMKGLYAWVGYPQMAVSYVVADRVGGSSKWRPLHLLRYALDGITSFSIVPIRMATIIGLLTACISFLYGSWIVVRTLLFGDPVPGFPTLMAAILFLGGLQLIAIGILGEYVGRTFIEAKRRPLYLVQQYRPPSANSNASPNAEGS